MWSRGDGAHLHVGDTVQTSEEETLRLQQEILQEQLQSGHSQDAASAETVQITISSEPQVSDIHIRRHAKLSLNFQVEEAAGS